MGESYLPSVYLYVEVGDEVVHMHCYRVLVLGYPVQSYYLRILVSTLRPYVLYTNTHQIFWLSMGGVVGRPTSVTTDKIVWDDG